MIRGLLGLWFILISIATFASAAQTVSDPVPASPSAEGEEPRAAPGGDDATGSATSTNPTATGADPATTAPDTDTPSTTAPTLTSLSASLDPSAALAAALDGQLAEREAEVVRLEATLEEARRASLAESARYQEDVQRVAELASRLRIAEQRSVEVDAIYDEIVDALTPARRRLREALADRHAFSSRTTRDTADRDRVDRDLDAADLAPAIAERVERLDALRTQARDLSMTLAQQRLQACDTAIDLRGQIVTRLNAAKMVALEQLSAGKRRDVLGLSREGVAELKRELGQVGLAARLHLARRRHDLREAPAQLSDLFRVGSLTFYALQTLALIIIATWFGRQIGPWTRQIRAAARRHYRTRRALRFTDAACEFVHALAPWSIFLGAVALLPSTLGGAAELPEVRLALRLAMLYGGYRVALDAVFAASVSLARKYHLALDAGRTALLLRSVKTVLRVSVAVLLLLAISQTFLGRGYLFHVVLRLSWIFVVIAMLRVVNAWRPAIAEAYLLFRSDGLLSRLVQRSQDRWYGVFVVAASFVVLAVRGIAIFGRDFAMGFEQTRRALAFLVRRRMEKQAEREGYADGDLTRLPEAVHEAFVESPVLVGESGVPHYPGLEAVQSSLAAWAEAGDDAAAGSCVLIGERGSGKSCWLDQVEVPGVDVRTIGFERRLRTRAELGDFLIEKLELGAEGSGLRAAKKALLEGPRRIVALDGMHNLFLARVGGYDLFEEFVEFVEQTSTRVGWICGVDAFAWDRLFVARPELAVFEHQLRLEPWTEEQIATLIRTRNSAAGIRVVFDDVLADRAARDLDARLEAEQAFYRLLWDYSDGNPRSAMHFWLRSLVVESDQRLRVRLFRRPDTESLDAMQDEGRFLLAAILSHENLSLREASMVTRYPPGVCHLRFGQLVRRGVLERAGGRYRVTTAWHRATVRFLRRRNLLST